MSVFLMPKARHYLTLLVGLLLGCGGGTPSTIPTTAPPHGGSLLNLPDGKGYVEIVIKPIKQGDKSQSEFQIYFLGPDRNSALSPAPSVARLTVSLPVGEKTIELQPKDGVFLSPPAESLLNGHDLSGNLNVDLGSGPIKIEISNR